MSFRFSPSCGCCDIDCPGGCVFFDDEFDTYTRWSTLSGGAWRDVAKAWRYDASAATYEDITSAVNGSIEWPVFPANQDTNDILYLGFGARFDRVRVTVASSVTVTLAADAVVGSTSLTVESLIASIPSGTALDFGGGATCTTTAAASRGGTSLSVTALGAAAASGATSSASIGAPNTTRDVTWQYWFDNGIGTTGWSTPSGGTTDGTDSFRNVGANLVSFSPQQHQGLTTVNGSSSLYWWRAVLGAGTTTLEPIGKQVEFASWNRFVGPVQTGGGGSDVNKIKLQGNGNAALVSAEANPYGSPVRIAAHVKCPTGMKVRLLGDVLDADNYLAAQLYVVSASCGELRLISRVAGVESTLVGPLYNSGQTFEDTWHRLVLCYRPKVVDSPETQDNMSFVNVELYPNTTGVVDGSTTVTELTNTGGRIWRPQVSAFGSPLKVGLETVGTDTGEFDQVQFSTTAAMTSTTPADCDIADPAFNDLTGLQSVSGSWSATGGVLSTSSANAIILDSATRTERVIVTSNITLGSTTDVARVLVGYSGVDDYFYVEASSSSGTLRIRIGKRIAASETVMATEVIAGVSATDPVDLIVYQCETDVSYKVNARAQSAYQAMGVASPGKNVGLGTVATASGVDFTGYSTQYHRSTRHPTCPGKDTNFDNCDTCQPCHLRWVYTSHTETSDLTGNPTVSDCRWSVLSGTFNDVCTAIPFTSNYSCVPKGQGEILLADRFGHVIDIDDNQSIFVEPDVDFTTPGRIRIKVDYVDEDNYLFGEYDLSASPITASVGKVVGGTETVLDTSQRLDWLTAFGTTRPSHRGVWLGMFDGNMTIMCGGGLETSSTDCCRYISKVRVTSTPSPTWCIDGPSCTGGSTTWADATVTPAGGTKVVIEVLDQDGTLNEVYVYNGCAQ